MQKLSAVVPMLVVGVSGCSAALPAFEPALHPASHEIATSNDGGAFTSGGCVLSGVARQVAGRARVRGGIEMVPSRTRLALGFTTSPHEAVTLDLDPGSASVVRRTERHSSEVIDHATVMLSADQHVDAVIDEECSAPQLSGARTVHGPSPFIVGLSRGWLSWATCNGMSPVSLWGISKEENAISDLQGVARANDGFVIVLRRENALFMGELDADKKAMGPLRKIAEAGWLRSPALAESGGNVLVSWAERPDANANLRLAAVSIPVGQAPRPLHLEIPTRTGMDASSPALAAIDNGRFLLVWTEGSSSSSEVRALTLDVEGHAFGEALSVSPQMNGGWGRAAVSSDGRGAIAFLASNELGFELAVAPVVCPVTHASADTVVASRE
jgi:hypothetical protein